MPGHGREPGGFAWPLRAIAPDRWQLSLPLVDLTAALPALLAAIGPEYVEDVRLQTHSLEDVYLALGAAG